MTAYRDRKSKKTLEQMQHPAKLLDYFLWSNRRNLNQTGWFALGIVAPYCIGIVTVALCFNKINKQKSTVHSVVVVRSAKKDVAWKKVRGQSFGSHTINWILTTHLV